MTDVDRAARILAEEAEWRHTRDQARPAVGASGVGMTALADIGWTVWSKTRGWAGVDDNGDQVEPKGGIVVGIVDRADDDGELHRVLVCYDRTRLPQHRMSHIDEADVDRDSIELGNTAAWRHTIRALARQLADDQRTINFDAEHRVATIHLLRGLLA